MINTLAYNDTELITVVKKFWDPRVVFTKLIMTIHEISLPVTCTQGMAVRSSYVIGEYYPCTVKQMAVIIVV